MSSNGHTDARQLHARLNHPVIDADGHWIEYLPVMREEFRRIGGDAAVEALAIATQRVPNSLGLSLDERRRRRVGQEAFWSSPSENVLDRATAMLPRLMYERLDDLGIDFCVVYPTSGLSFHRMPDARLRRAICRSYNVFTADQFKGLGDRIIPAAIIPMYTPDEAIEEIDFAVKQLGYKVLMVGGLMLSAFFPTQTTLPHTSLASLVRDILSLQPDGSTVMLAGLVVLMFTPFVRVLTALAGFAAERDWRFVAVAALVFLMLIGELLYSLH